MLITELPAEIMSQILSSIAIKEDIRECTAVCKIWRRQMVLAHYQDIVIDKASHEQLLREVQTKIYNNGEIIGDFVKNLTFVGDAAKTVLSQESFEQLIDNLPSLQAIRFHPSSVHKTIRYLEYLDRIAVRTELQEVSILGNVPNDKVIDKLSQLCYSINYQLKDQITALTILDTSIQYQHEGYQDIVDYIKVFTNLKHLTLYETNNQRGNGKTIDVTSVLDACCDHLWSLKRENNAPWYITPGKHKYHLNLTSLSLTLPEFTEDHIEYLVEYLPNLKEFDLKIGFGENVLMDGSASLPPDTFSKFALYLKQLRRFNSTSKLYGSSMDREAYWDTMEAIYNNQTFSNLCIHFVAGEALCESMRFDKRTFHLQCQHETWELGDIDYLYDFLSLNSIHIRYDVKHFEEVGGVQNLTTIQGLFYFAVSQQRPQIHLVMDDQQLILCTKPVKRLDKVPFVFPQDFSPVEHAYLENVHLDNHLLDKIDTFYPRIKVIQLINCTIQAQDCGADCYVIDLRKYWCLQDLVLDVGSMQEQNDLIVFKWTNNDQEKHYCYNRSISRTTMYVTQTSEAISDGTFVVKIDTVGLQRLIFQKYGRSIGAFTAKSIAKECHQF